MTDFVHLHLHTEYSLLDGAVRLVQPVVDPSNPNKTKKIHPLSQALKDMGMDAVAITDHGNMYGAYSFVQTLRGDGIKPIVGEEFYVAEDLYVKTPEVLKQRYHLILLAKNQKGYENLMKLSSKAFVDGFYMRPRIDLDHIAQHSEGLICLSACLAGKIPRLILAGKYEEAKQYAIRMRDIFAEGDFYIEIQDHHLPEDAIVNNQLVKIAREIGVKIVATNDVHYLKREDADMQDTMMCITLGCKKSDDKTNSARFSNDEFYLKSGDEMAELFSWCPEAIANTREIADKVEDYFVLKRPPVIPAYRNDEMGDRNEEQYLHDLAWEGLKRRYHEITPEMENRIKHELDVIHTCGYDGYFLIVWDYVNAAKKMGIPVGPGRGSGCGSIVAYSIGITDIDPLKYQLLFERFLSQERVSMPDFDVDFCFVRRQEVIDYCIQKYGKDNVTQIIAYSTMSAKAVVKDVARVLDVPYAEAAQWVKEIPVGKVLLPQVLTEGSDNFSPEFKKIYDSSPIAKSAIDLAMRLEGMPRQTSMHAAGVVICRDPVENYCALSRNGSGSDSVITTQFDKNIIEDVGLLKMDFLGLKTLTDINEALKLIKADKGVDIDFNELGYEDPKVYELIASGDCEAVFQLESGGMKRFMARLQPDSLEDVIAGISLYRPGPMQFVDDFIEGKKHPENVKYAHPILKEVLGNTYGCIVYQEQVMQIAQKMAGFSFGGADIMRRAMSKKKADVLLAMRDVFLNGGVLSGDATKKMNVGAVANGVDREIADHLFDQIMKFAEYAFNKSHAAAYTFLTYQTAYLKLYYPTHFIVAVVNNRITNADEVKHYMNYLKRTGVKVLPPDINRSEKLFSIDNDNVRYGLSGIKNVGEAATEYIISERNSGGPFKDLRDLLERCSEQINKRMLESLIKGGALDCFGYTRSTLMASYERIMDDVVKSKKNRMSAQMSLFDDMVEYKDKYSEIEEYPKLQRLSMEKEVLGMYLSGHPLDDYKEKDGEFNFDTSQLYIEQADEDGNVGMVIDQSLGGKPVRFGCIVASYDVKNTKQQTKFAVGRLEDRSGSVAFTMYARAYEKYAQLISGDAPIKVSGKIDLRDESEPKINIDSVEVWHNSAQPVQTAQKSDDDGQSKGILYVLVNSPEERSTVAEVLQMYEGATPCQAQVTYEGKPKLLQYPNKVRICDELLARLADLLGNNRVRYVVKK